MSVAVVKVENDKIILGADSIIVYGQYQQKEDKAKIRVINQDFAFAMSGLARETSLFEMFCKTHTPSNNNEESIIDFFNEFSGWLKKKIDDDFINSSYLIIYQGKAFEYVDYYVKEIKDYACIGAGWNLALASMYHGKTVKEAIECACELSIYCEKPVNIIEIKK